MVVPRTWFREWYSFCEDSPQGEWDKIAELMRLKFGESRCPVFRATNPLSRGMPKSEGGGKLSIHCRADFETIETNFRIIVSANQISLYGAVAEMCEECESCFVRTGRPVMSGHSNPLFVPRSVMKTPTLLTDDPSQDLLQKHQERG